MSSSLLTLAAASFLATQPTVEALPQTAALEQPVQVEQLSLADNNLDPASLLLVADGATKKKNPWLAAGLNFFLPGSGYLYNGERKALGAGFMVGAVGLTIVEQSDAWPDAGIKTANPQLFNIMFASVPVMNTC